MNKSVLNLARVAVIVSAAAVTIAAAANSLQAVSLLIAGLIFRDFFSSKIYDPIFKDESAQTWAFNGIKKWATRRRPTSKFDI